MFKLIVRREFLYYYFQSHTGTENRAIKCYQELFNRRSLPCNQELFTGRVYLVIKSWWTWDWWRTTHLSWYWGTWDLLVRSITLRTVTTTKTKYVNAILLFCSIVLLAKFGKEVRQIMLFWLLCQLTRLWIKSHHEFRNL